MTPTDVARAAVVIPTLDEAAHLPALLAELRADDGGRVGSIWVADGGSTDATVALAHEAARADERVRVIANPGRTQARAMNLAAAHIRAMSEPPEYLVRMDAHSTYPAGYASRVVEALERTGAASVVVPMTTLGGGPWQEAGRVIFNSFVGTGGSPHRTGGDGWVDHGHHAGFRRTVFDELGGYDESFRANEDAEYDARVVASGGRIYLAGELAVGYRPRPTLAASWRQFRGYGTGRAQTLLKHRRRIQARQLAPVLVTAVVALSTAIAVLRRSARWLAVPAAYVAAVAGAVATVAVRPGETGSSDGAKRRESPGALARAVVLAVTVHIAYGLGYLHELVRRGLGQRRSARSGPGGSS